VNRLRPTTLGDSFLTSLSASAGLRRRPRPGLPTDGWAMLLMSAVALALTAPGQTAAISVFVDPMLSELGMERSVIAAAYLAGTLMGALAMPWTGRAIDRLGTRRVMIPVVLVFGAALVGFSLVEDIWGVTLGFLAVRMLGQGALTLIATTAVAVWFDRRRGAALGVVLAVGSVGISLSPLLLERLIADHGWRSAWLIEGLVIWAVLLPIALLGMRERRRPAVHARPDETGIDERGAGRSKVATSFTRAQALRSPFFWLITLAVASAALLTTAVAFHQIDLLAERGLRPTDAAANFLPQTVAGLAATVVMGLLSDRMAPRPLLAASTGLLAASLIMGVWVTPGWSAIAFGAMIGFGAGGIRALEASTLPRYFGLAHLGAIRGVVLAIGVGASAFGPILFALGREALGSYGPALLAGALIPIGLTIAAFVVEPPPAPERQHRPAARPASAPIGPLVPRPTASAD
jgi:MFS family permease